MPFSSSPLETLRGLFDKHNIGYYIVLTQDEHDSEYVSEADRRRAFISGFTGSAGTAIIGKDFAELSTDGRYFLQAEKELPVEWTLRKEGSKGVEPWYKALAARARKSGLNIGVDPKLIEFSALNLIKKELAGSTAEIRGIEENLIDAVWPNKPAQPQSTVFELPVSVTGLSYEEKLANLRKTLVSSKAKAILISALDEIAWLFNLRGSDVEYNPVFKSFAVISDTDAKLYVDEAKVKNVKANLANVQILPYDQVFQEAAALEAHVSKSKEAGVSADEQQKLWVPKGSSWALIEAAGGFDNVISEPSPVEVSKGYKNSVEVQGAKLAQIKCGLSIVAYFAWLSRELKSGNTSITEYDGSRKLLEIREQLEDFRGQSFESISSVGPNAAVIHYAPSAEGKVTINDKEIYLLDSGCQFTHGTTDTTRTVHFGTPTDEERRAYTLVLKGHIGLATLVFPSGTTGVQIDVLARQHLWKYGLDYLHGTGHGVGAFLNVHEGPIGIAPRRGRADVGLEVGHLISNEPGFYEDGKYGIRIESLILVTEANTPHKFADRKYLEFETITRVPLALNLIDVTLLSNEERTWINDYSALVRKDLSEHLSTEDRAWLEENTKAI